MSFAKVLRANYTVRQIHNSREENVWFITALSHTHIHNCLMALSPGPPGWASTSRNIHPLTPILIIGHPLSTSSIYYDPQYPPCSTYVLDSPFRQPLSRSALVFLLVWDPLLLTLNVSLPNHHLLFTTHAHTIAACSAAIIMLCHLFLISQLPVGCIKAHQDISYRTLLGWLTVVKKQT